MKEAVQEIVYKKMLNREFVGGCFLPAITAKMPVNRLAAVQTFICHWRLV
jgi:hypothetical protein